MDGGFDLLLQGDGLDRLTASIEREKLRRAAQTSLISFTEYTFPKYRPAAHHYAIARVLEAVLTGRGGVDRLMILTAPRHGKKAAHDTPIWTPQGWRTHGDLRPGDFVYHPSGKAVRVIAISDESPVDRAVEFSNGEVVTCHAQHEWQVVNTGRNPSTVDVLETQDMEGREIARGTPGQRGCQYRWKLEDSAPLEGVVADLPLHPYALGVWLGDGSTGAGLICGAEQDRAVMERAAQHIGPYWVTRHKTTGVLYYRFGQTARVKGSNALARRLRDLGVLHCKRIPVAYLTASVEQRLQLLAGLVDTDGHVEAHTGRVRFVTGDPALRDDVHTLAASLGFKPYITEQAPQTSSSGVEGRRTVYTVGFQPTPASEIPCELARKRLSVTPRKRRVSVRAVRRVPEKMGRCIQVDAADGLYLIGRTMLPTHNSELCSRRFPAFALGQYPELEFMSTSAGADLAGVFGGEVRDIIQSPEYRAVFPGTQIKADEAAKGRWRTEQGGAYNAFGVGGRPVGFGGDIIMIDDPFGSMEDATSQSVRTRVQNWYSGTLYHRLQPNGKIVLINHRMHEDDLSGYLLRQEEIGGDKWFVLCLPAELDEAAADYLNRTKGEALWEESFPLADLRRKKVTLGSRNYAALYLQDPKAAEDGIHKKKWFQVWPAGDPFPVFDFVLQSYDTAFTDNTKNDPTANVTLGVFKNEKGQPSVMVIDGWEEHIDYPDLRKRIRKDWEDTSYGETWGAEDDAGLPILNDMSNPKIGKGAETPQGRKADVVLIETKGSGVAIIRELRQRAGVPITGYSPSSGFSGGLGLGRGDKTSRVHAVAPYAEARRVYIPESGYKKGEFVDWAAPLVEQLCSYKFEGSIPHDDLLDAYSQALLYLINYGLLSVEDVDEEDIDKFMDDDDDDEDRFDEDAPSIYS